MPTFAVSALLAVLGGVVVIVVGFVPYVAWSYRRRGVFGFGHAFLAGCTAVYALALWTYTILPLPDPATICRRVPAPQLRPFQFVADIGEAMATGGPVRAVVAQVVLNVVLFVPLGMLARHLFRRGFVVTVLLGLGTSLLIEVTQLTGNWGLYPCAYRLFDVDDLIANTGGAALGFLAAPVLRLVPGQRTLDVRLPRPVTTGRRLLGMVLDVSLVQLSALLVWLPLGSLLLASGALDSVRISEAAGWVPPSLSLLFGVVLLVGVPLLGHGATPGQRMVLLRPQTEDGAPPPIGRRLLRAASGSGGYVLLSGLNDLLGWAPLGALATMLGLAGLFFATRGDHRGLSGMVARLRVVDAREPWTAMTAAQRWAAAPELRRLSLAVIAFGALLQLGFLGLVQLAFASGSAQPVVLVGILGLIALAAVGSVVFLLVNGLAMVRREGRSLGNLLTLLVGLGFCGLTVLTVVALFSSSRLLAVSVAVAWVLVAYLSFVFGAFVLYGLLYARRDPSPGADAVIVLGSGIFGTRVPPLLASRLDRGRAVLDAELGRGGDAVCVCSGGQGPGEDVPEGEAMAGYLVDAGVPEELLRRETASRTTEENLLLSLELLRAEGRGERVVVVTNDFHAFRTAIITRELGLVAQVVGSPTARYFLPSAILREFVGVLARKPWPHVLVAAAVIGLGFVLAS